MADPFIGEIRIFAGSFAPRDWAFCNGQTIQVGQNPALFSIFGAIFGGDGRNDFGVPNLPGRAPMGAGSGSGLTSRALNQNPPGASEVTLNSSHMPGHTHNLQGSSDRAELEGTTSPADTYTGRTDSSDRIYGPSANLVDMDSSALETVGGGQAHTNMQPYLGINFVVALNGIFPTRN